jgi:hypothetical protein
MRRIMTSVSGKPMTSRIPEASPRTYARVGGMLYLFIIVAALDGAGYLKDLDSRQLDDLASPCGSS